MYITEWPDKPALRDLFNSVLSVYFRTNSVAWCAVLLRTVRSRDGLRVRSIDAIQE